jgi:hypothetical protein
MDRHSPKIQLCSKKATISSQQIYIYIIYEMIKISVVFVATINTTFGNCSEIPILLNIFGEFSYEYECTETIFSARKPHLDATYVVVKWCTMALTVKTKRAWAGLKLANIYVNHVMKSSKKIEMFGSNSKPDL